MAKIYVASSWRNQFQPQVVRRLQLTGHEVYDFRNPPENKGGFHWSDVAEDWQQWSTKEYVKNLSHPVSEHGFKCDMDAMEWADVCVLVLPCGRSAHAEAGWFAGAGKKVVAYIPEKQEPELMYKMFDLVTDDMGELLRFLQPEGCEFLHMWPDYGDALFWDIEGACCGGKDCLFLDDDTKIELTGIKGLKEWYSQWDVESLDHKFGWTDKEWENWRERGLALAKQIKALLPDTVDFYYMWKTDKIWDVNPEGASDGGVLAVDAPMPVE